MALSWIQHILELPIPKRGFLVWDIHWSKVLVYVTSPPHRFIEVPSKEAAAGGYSYTQKIHAGITVETATPCCFFIPVLLGILEQEQW